MNMRNRSVLLQCGAWLVLMLAAAFLSKPAKAQMNWGEEYARRLRSTELATPLGDDAFGDKINLYNGTVSFRATDISIPGNNALPVRLARSYEPQDVSLPRFLGTWDLDIPHISDIAPEGHDGGFPVPATWSNGSVEFRRDWYSSGSRLHVNGAGGDILIGADDPKRLHPSAMSISTPRTKDGWYVTTILNVRNGAGVGYIAHAPDGTRYTFDWLIERDYSGISHPWKKVYLPQSNVLYRKKLMLFVSKIEDRFGNWVKYDWEGERLTRIHSNDGREIVLRMEITNQTNYGRNVWSLMSATAGGQTWTYNGDPGVTNPDGSRWKYARVGHRLDVISYEKISGSAELRRNDEVPCSPANVFVKSTVKYTVTHPAGATAEFEFQPMRHGRTQVKFQCLSNGAPDNETADSYRNDYATFHDVWSVTKKRITGPALSEAIYRYEYAGLRQGFQAQDESQFPFEPGWNAKFAPVAPNRKVVTVHEPNGSQQVHTFGKDWDLDEGQLLKVETRMEGRVLRAVTNAYVSASDAASLPFPTTYGRTVIRNGDQLPNATRPLKSKVTVQDGAEFSWKVAETCGGLLCFDRQGRPTVVVKDSSLNAAKFETTTFHDDTVLWVLGQVARTRVLGSGLSVETGRTVYSSQTALPIATYGSCTFQCPGLLKGTMDYRVDLPSGDPQRGTLRSITDAAGSVTSVNNWFRGTPREIHHPPTPESPGGAYERSQVNPDGSIAWVEDESGFRTCYAYDAMGRQTSITYPSESALNTCSTEKWLPTVTEFKPVAVAEFGVPAGHWRRIVRTGNSTAITYFDGLWRPVAEEQFDAALPSVTRTIKVKRYERSGQLLFESVPMGAVNSIGETMPGARHYYDGLKRLLRTEQDSELAGTVSTRTEYLEGYVTRSIDPKGVVSTSRYMAYDTPTTDWPVEITQALGTADQVSTIVSRDVLGTTRSITRRNTSGSASATRTYLLDEFRRLCGVGQPETGLTLTDYDLVGNPIWTASGLPIGTSCDAGSDARTTQARKVQRTFDRRGRVTTIRFPDGRGDQDWIYAPDGLVTKINTFNDSDNTQPVVNGYSYNRRRQLIGESVSQPGRYTWSLGYGYNALGHISVSLVQPNGEVIDYSPNALGQPTRVRSEEFLYANAVEYHPGGKVKSFSYANGVRYEATLNERGFLGRYSYSKPDGLELVSNRLEYDKSGNTVSLIDEASATYVRGTRFITYDALNRLTSAQSPKFASGGSGDSINYSYDALDNLVRVLAPTRDHYYCYDTSTWKLTSIRTAGCAAGNGASVIGMEYDVQGNLTNKNGQLMSFDYGNRLREVVGKEVYRYDGRGRRVQSASPDGDILSHYGADGALRYQQNFRRGYVSSFIYLGQKLIAERRKAMGGGAVATYFQHTDHLGSPVLITNQLGQLVRWSDYEPYGLAMGRSNSDGPEFTGHIGDGASGLIYMQQRYYDPGIGRFLSVDPVIANSSTGSNFNRYWYANNNPYKSTDPDGRFGKPKDAPYLYVHHVQTTEKNGAIKVERIVGADNAPAPRTDRGSVLLVPQRSADGAPAAPGPVITERLMNFSEKVGETVEVTSGQRTREQNAAVGGAPGSEHLKKNAADIRISGFSRTETADAAHASGEFNRVNEYPDARGVHVDLKADGNQGRFDNWRVREDE